MARSDYDIINLSLEHELNEWLAERGYAGLADNRNRLAEVVTRKLQDSFYIVTVSFKPSFASLSCFRY
ncbi:hypothetical protein FVD31_002564 [Escherichia coli O103:H2]|nr:hypothetical protein [Escherichia coli]EES2576472.1 hypothetical protein [Escherichia coli O103:H2]EQW40331.1 hypothetical protein G904_04017 [Escherichia coli UMEA 3065-1]KEJ07053.1 hypothetical protein AB50_4178 [Escherichia coli 6-175-07_S1_C2]KEM49734.1 hypothetical protein AB79_4315 [Escherichia coli 6-175-07_S1_C3]